jgi:hypothetical protein
LRNLSGFDSSGNRITTPPGQIIDGDAEEKALGDAIAMQMVGTGVLVGRQILYARTEGMDAVFEVQFDDGSGMVFKMLDYVAKPSDEKTLKQQGKELMSGEEGS